MTKQLDLLSPRTRMCTHGHVSEYNAQGKCKVCVAARSAAYHARKMQDDPDYVAKRRARALIANKTPEHRERAREAKRKRWREDPEYRAKRLEDAKKQHPESRADAHRRRMTKPGARERARTEWMLKSYGLTMEQYAELLAAQGGHCALCPAVQHSPTVDRRLGVDHEHANSRIRGLLCHACNVTLGLHGDTLEAFCESSFGTSIVIAYFRGPADPSIQALIEWYRAGGPRQTRRLAVVRDAP